MNSNFNSQPLASIIMNCFNGELFLKDSINSVLDQTYKNWELIFWDNKSTDKSAEIFKSYKDKRFKYFYAEKHTSLYKARNLAIDKSKGNFISFLDTDDLLNKNKLELQIPYFKDEKVGVVFGNVWIIKKNICKKKIYEKNILPRGNIFIKIVKKYNVGLLSALIRKTYFLKLEEKFDERFSMIGDFDLFLRLSKICIFESIQLPLGSYRIHNQNLTTLMKNRETEEMDIWIKENKCNLDKFNMKIISKKNDDRKFVNFKIDKNYKECCKMFLSSKVRLLSVKNLFIFFTPVFLLKKLLWFHQD